MSIAKTNTPIGKNSSYIGECLKEVQGQYMANTTDEEAINLKGVAAMNELNYGGRNSIRESDRIPRPGSRWLGMSR